MSTNKQTLKPGMKVTLKANKKEGWSEETGTILEVGKKVITVEVEAAEAGDDGLREVTRDQIKLMSAFEKFLDETDPDDLSHFDHIQVK